MIRICFLLGGFKGNGGIGRVSAILANKLCEDEGYEISTVSFVEDEEPKLYPLSNHIIQRHLYTSSINMKTALLCKNAVGRLSKIIKELKIDILVACGALFFPIATISSRISKIKCICWEHSNANNIADHQFQNFCRRFGTRRADALVVLTKADLKLYKEKFQCKKIFQIYNPAEISKELSIKYALESHKIISVGRLCYQKNYPFLVKIAKKVLTCCPDWSWDIYGAGPDYSAIKNLIEAENLAGRLVLRGQVEDLYDRYDQYSFYVLTSRYEGFGMAMLEAMSNGLPAVSFDIEAGPSEIIENQRNGVLVPKFDEDKMVDEICRLCRCSEIRQQYSDRAQQVRMKFDLDNIIAQWNQVFKDIYKDEIK